MVEHKFTIPSSGRGKESSQLTAQKNPQFLTTRMQTFNRNLLQTISLYHRMDNQF